MFFLQPVVPNHDQDSFITGTAPSFSIKRYAIQASTWALFIKHSSPKWREQTSTLAKLHCCPGKTNYILTSHNGAFFGKLNKVIFPLQPKTHFIRDFFLSKSCAALSTMLMGLLLLLLSLWLTCVPALPGTVPIQGIPPFMTSWRTMLLNAKIALDPLLWLTCWGQFSWMSHELRLCL